MSKYPTNRTLAAELVALRTETEFNTNKKIAQMLGINGVTETFLSKYINDNLDREVPEFESLAFDIIKNLRSRIEFKCRIFPSSVITKIENALGLLRDVGHIGCIVGPAGHGKTSALREYLKKTPSAILITANESMRDGKKLEAAIFARINSTTWDRQSSRFDFLKDRFNESSRPILIDNFQRLTGSGLKWLFDFHDETKSPIGCIGNPEAIAPIMKNSQHSRRLGLTTPYQLDTTEIPDLAKNIALQHTDADTVEKIADLVTHIAMQVDQGCLGAVEMTVSLMEKLRKLSPDLAKDPRKALRSAHARLPRNYSLPAD